MFRKFELSKISQNKVSVSFGIKFYVKNFFDSKTSSMSNKSSNSSLRFLPKKKINKYLIYDNS